MMRFYNVRTRDFVDVDDKAVTKKKYVRQTKNGKTQTRYAVRANYNGAALTKFISESTFLSLSAPEES